MNISDSDVQKIKIITVSAQVNDLVVLLSNIDKESLLASIDSVKPENRNSMTYRFLIYAMAFYNNIEMEFDQRETENLNEELQFKFPDFDF